MISSLGGSGLLHVNVTPTTLGLSSFIPELHWSIDDKVTVVRVLLPLVALDIRDHISGFVVGNDVEEDSDTAKDGGQISPATTVVICAISSCKSLAGNDAEDVDINC